MVSVSTETQALLDDSVIVDLLIPGAPMGFWYSDPVKLEALMGRYERPGLSWVSFTVSADHFPSISDTTRYIASARRWLLDHPDRFMPVHTTEDVRAAKAAGRLGWNFNFQGTNMLMGNLDMVEVYRQLGVGHMLLAYNAKNRVGDGCHERTASRHSL